MITMAQNRTDPDQIQMAAPSMPPEMQAPPLQTASVDPHDTLTVPIGPPPLEVPTMAGAAAAKGSPKMSLLAPQEEHIDKNLMADYRKDADPYGSADNHPGFFGKLLHGLNVATGGETRRGWEEQGLEKRLQDLSKEESAEGLQGAQAENQTAEAGAKLHPLEKPQKPAKWKTLFGGNGELVKAPNGQVLQQDDEGNLRAVPLPEGTTVAPKPAAGGHSAFDEWSANPEKYAEFQKALGDIKAEVAAEHPQQAKNASFMNIYAAQRFLQMAYTHNPELLPVASKMIGKLLHLSPEETAQIGSVPEDQPLSPETGNLIGTSMPEAPTAGTRGQAQTAARVLTEMPRIRTEVTNAASHLGPVAGREAMGFLLGVVGSTGNAALDRQLAELRGDLTFTGSAAAKFHLNSVRAMETYDRLIGEGKNTAAAIQGTLDSVESWAKTAQAQERGHESGEHKTGTAVGKTSKPDGIYEMNGKRYRVEGGNVYAQ